MDDFSIGGRWSGLLTDHKYDLWELYGPPGAEGKSESEVLELVFLGHEDDAQVVTEELYERFLKQWEEGAADVVCGRIHRGRRFCKGKTLTAMATTASSTSRRSRRTETSLAEMAGSRGPS